MLFAVYWSVFILFKIHAFLGKMMVIQLVPLGRPWSVVPIIKRFWIYSTEKFHDDNACQIVIHLYEWFPFDFSWKTFRYLESVWKVIQRFKRVASVISESLSRLHSQKPKLKDNEIFSMTSIPTVFCKTVVNNMFANKFVFPAWKNITDSLLIS